MAFGFLPFGFSITVRLDTLLYHFGCFLTMTVPIPISLWSIAILGAIPLLAIPYALYVVLIAERPYPGIPLVDGTDGLTEAKKRFMANSRKVVLSAVSQV